MKLKIRNRGFLLCLTFIIFSCESFESEEPFEVMGFRPIYGSAEDLEIRTLPPRDVCEAGKIYIFGDYLFVNEVHKGIHIIDNSDPTQPENISFLQITGNVDMAVKDGFLYADHLTSLVVFDVRQPENIKFLKAVEQTFNLSNTLYPPQTGVSFECVDPSKGPVIGWSEALLVDPKCFR